MLLFSVLCVLCLMALGLLLLVIFRQLAWKSLFSLGVSLSCVDSIAIRLHCCFCVCGDGTRFNSDCFAWFSRFSHQLSIIHRVQLFKQCSDQLWHCEYYRSVCSITLNCLFGNKKHPSQKRESDYQQIRTSNSSTQKRSNAVSPRTVNELSKAIENAYATNVRSTSFTSHSGGQRKRGLAVLNKVCKMVGGDDQGVIELIVSFVRSRAVPPRTLLSLLQRVPTAQMSHDAYKETKVLQKRKHADIENEFPLSHNDSSPSPEKRRKPSKEKHHDAGLSFDDAGAGDVCDTIQSTMSDDEYAYSLESLLSKMLRDNLRENNRVPDKKYVRLISELVLTILRARFDETFGSDENVVEKKHEPEKRDVLHSDHKHTHDSTSTHPPPTARASTKASPSYEKPSVDVSVQSSVSPPSLGSFFLSSPKLPQPKPILCLPMPVAHTPIPSFDLRSLCTTSVKSVLQPISSLPSSLAHLAHLSTPLSSHAAHTANGASSEPQAARKLSSASKGTPIVSCLSATSVCTHDHFPTSQNTNQTSSKCTQSLDDVSCGPPTCMEKPSGFSGEPRNGQHCPAAGGCTSVRVPNAAMPRSCLPVPPIPGSRMGITCGCATGAQQATCSSDQVESRVTRGRPAGENQSVPLCEEEEKNDGAGAVISDAAHNRELCHSAAVNDKQECNATHKCKLKHDIAPPSQLSVPVSIVPKPDALDQKPPAASVPSTAPASAPPVQVNAKPFFVSPVSNSVQASPISERVSISKPPVLSQPNSLTHAQPYTSQIHVHVTHTIYTREEMDKIVKEHTSARDFDKRVHASKLALQLTLKEMRAMGFKISERAFATARRHARTYGEGAPVPKPQQPKSKLKVTQQEKDKIVHFLTEHSSEAAHRTVGAHKATKHKPARTPQPVRYLDSNVAWLYREFKRKLENEQKSDASVRVLSESAFRKNIPKYFKQARKKSDRCEYCDEGRASIKRLRQLLSRCRKGCDKHTNSKSKQEKDKDGDEEMGDETEEEAKVPKTQERSKEEEEAEAMLEECGCEEELEEKERAKLPGLRKDVETWLLHREYNVEQRKAFKKEVETLGTDEALVLYDYKENVMTHKGPDEKSGDFRRRTPRSVLGVIVYSRKQESGPIQKEFIGIFSEVLSKDGLFSSDNIRQVVLKRLPDKPSILLWSDSGPHFRCKDYMYFALHELPVKHNKRVRLNTFMEKHGKNGVDGFFSLVGKWLEEEETQQAINTTEDFVKALQHRASQANSDPNITYTFEIYKRASRPPTYKGIANLKPRTYHSYMSVPDEKSDNHVSIHAKVLASDPNTVAVPIKPKIKEFRDERDDKMAHEKEEKGEKATLHNLSKVQKAREDVYFAPLIALMSSGGQSKRKRKRARVEAEKKEGGPKYDWFPTSFAADGANDDPEMFEAPALPPIFCKKQRWVTHIPRRTLPSPQRKPRPKKTKRRKKDSVEDAWTGRD